MAKKKAEPVINMGLPGWMGTYGDLVTLLLCFFVLLFAMSSIDVTKYKLAVSSFKDNAGILDGGESLIGKEMMKNGVSQLSDFQVIIDQIEIPDPGEESDGTDPNEGTSDVEYKGETEIIAEEVKEYFDQQDIGVDVQVAYTGDYVKLSLSGETLFDSGKAQVKDGAKEFLESISQFIIDNNYDEYALEIDGHTDNRPINSVQYPNNWYLSAARAIAVGSVFTEEYGFDPTMVACTGHGEHIPIADNQTAEGRALNRRVELKLVVKQEEKSVEEVIVGE